MIVQIENIPLPADSPYASRGGGRRKYPWHELEVGQSFLMAGVKRNTASVMAWRMSRRLERRFRCLAEGAAVRVFRVE